MTWISSFFLKFLAIFTKILAVKLENHGWYSWNSKKKVETSRVPGWARGPPLRPPLRPSGPAGHPRGFNLFFYRVSWNHPWFQVLPPKIFVKPPKISKKMMKPGHKKKMRGFPLKPDFSHVWHKIPFWIPKYNFIPVNPMTFFLGLAHHFKKLSTMSEFLLRLQFWVRSFGFKDWRWLRYDFDRLQRCFWLETFF